MTKMSRQYWDKMYELGASQLITVLLFVYY